MASIWTPDGEHRVPPPSSSEPVRSDPTDPQPSAVDHAASPLDPEEEAMRNEVAELERELLSAPVGDVIANHCYGLFQLAALHLGQRPPRLDDARLAIDALAAVTETLGERIGDSATTLREGLAQIRLAFVQIAGAAVASNGAAGADPVSENGTEPTTEVN